MAIEGNDRLIYEDTHVETCDNRPTATPPGGFAGRTPSLATGDSCPCELEQAQHVSHAARQRDRSNGLQLLTIRTGVSRGVCYIGGSKIGMEAARSSNKPVPFLQR